ncbi:MAG TPA: hypothetical protein VMT34_00845, partial [Aggregatilineales bacterium]|nr:hypothetical protein [Aggregatilineales bacterium]
QNGSGVSCFKRVSHRDTFAFHSVINETSTRRSCRSPSGKGISRLLDRLPAGAAKEKSCYPGDAGRFDITTNSGSRRTKTV